MNGRAYVLYINKTAHFKAPLSPPSSYSPLLCGVQDVTKKLFSACNPTSEKYKTFCTPCVHRSVSYIRVCVCVRSTRGKAEGGGGGRLGLARSKSHNFLALKMNIWSLDGGSDSQMAARQIDRGEFSLFCPLKSYCTASGGWWRWLWRARGPAYGLIGQYKTMPSFLANYSRAIIHECARELKIGTRLE